MVDQKETFEQFMKRVDAFVSSKLGLGVHDLPDACWYDLYVECRGDEIDDMVDDIVDTLRDADDQAANLLEEMCRG